MKRHRTADLEPTTFGGRYTLVRRLAVGGMAEIYLARQAAMAGFEKEVVIKRLRAELADDPRIVEMFLDEARIGALLNHPNIVHVYDVDEHDGIPYIAMEYIVGEELNELCRRGIQHARFLPLEHAVELMRQAAAGMGYFHAKRGAEGSSNAGEPLEIVHFDISPSNLLVTQDGFLKVIDFGIARARGQRARGETLPGKLSYMSPEQAARGPAPKPTDGGYPGERTTTQVDHRSDIFSLGIVLYEITVGRRLFRGNAQEVVQRLASATVEPPTFVRRNFPPALEAIVMRTLEKHPADRYQSAYDLADDLESFLRDERLHSGPVRIARYLDVLTFAAGGERRPELVSEAEQQGHTDELDFDQVSGPARSDTPTETRDWEDADQPEADVAAALGMELEELRAMRTPVPTRPAGMAPVRGDSAITPQQSTLRTDVPEPAERPKRPITIEEDLDERPRRPITVEEELDDEGALDPVHGHARTRDVPAEDARTIPLPARQLAPPAPPVPTPPMPTALVASPTVGGALLARAGSDGVRVAWVLVGVLGVAVAALVAYIVMT